MDSVGRFHVEEVEGKRSFVYNSPTTELAMDSVERFQVEEDDGEQGIVYFPAIFSSQTIFSCPRVWIYSQMEKETDGFVKIVSSSHFPGERLDHSNTHHVLPLFWCNNKPEDLSIRCYVCQNEPEESGSYIYYCEKCGKMYHKECVESPPQINHPLHPKHLLQLGCDFNLKDCFHCKKRIEHMGYYCTLCKFGMHPTCAMEPVSCVIDQCKRHDHPLTYFTRIQASLDCNVCGLINVVHPTYVCLHCNFVAHGVCVDSPHVIRISRHQHRISFALPLPPGNKSCGVCRKEVNREYGGYTCNKCDDDYVVHSRCALRKDIWDGEELMDVPEEDEEVIEPFERICDGIILHFSHKQHNLRLETSRVYDETKICEACVIPIYEGDFYSCGECDFILHNTCANAPIKKRHPLHPHPLILQVINGNVKRGYFKCVACKCEGSGFIYECKTNGCEFELDVRCASISEPFDYQGHEHPLFLALDPAEGKKYCQVCQSSDNSLLNCIECDYIICFKCVTIPYMARYKHDKHFLTLGYGGETSKPDWCEVCEKQLPSGREERFYTCNHCCTTLHSKCLLGEDKYILPGRTINIYGHFFKVLPNNSLSRPRCENCDSRCSYKMILRRRRDNKTWCSMDHVHETRIRGNK